MLKISKHFLEIYKSLILLGSFNFSVTKIIDWSNPVLDWSNLVLDLCNLILEPANLNLDLCWWVLY